MNLNNTKLNLSDFSETEREEILKAYFDTDATSIIPNFSKCNVFLRHHMKSMVTTCKQRDFEFFKNHEFTEVKPVKTESWEGFESFNSLSVGELIKSKSRDHIYEVKHAGALGAYCENQSESVVITNLNSHFCERKITKWSFEPVVDDSFAVEFFEVFRDKISKSGGGSIASWDEMPEYGRQAWRAVAALKTGKENG